MSHSDSAEGWSEAGLRPPKGWARIDVALPSLAINLLALALPIVVLQVYDRILPNFAVDTFTIMVVGLGAIVLIEGVLRLARAYVMNWTGARFEHAASMAAFDRLVNADLVRFELDAPGAHLDRLQAMDTLRDFYSGQAATVLVDLPFVVLFLALIWIIAGWLVLVPMVLLAVFALATLLLSVRLRDALRTRAAVDDRRYNFIIEAIGGVHTVKSMAMEPLILRRYERLQAQSAESVYRLSRLTSISSSLGASFSQFAMIMVVSIGAVYAVGGALTVGALAASTMLTGRAVQPVLRAMGLWTQFQSVALARQRMGEVFELPPEGQAVRPLAPTLSGDIEIEGLSFRYRDDLPLLFDEISLSVGRGRVVGITGSNGVGKTTLVSLIMGMSQPVGGRILIDGHDVSQLDPIALRTQIGLMPQNGALFQGTLLDNLTMFRDGEAVERAIDIARSLGLDDVIARLPDGLETRIGEGTVEALPNGVRQRIVMVRALVDDPPIILFDDANAMLDQQSDRMLRDYLIRFKGDRTMVIISHRPSFLSMCDVCHCIAGGKLHEIDLPAPRPRITAAASTGRIITMGRAE